MDIYKIIIPVVVGCIMGVGKVYLGSIKALKLKLKAVENGTQALLRSQIITIYNKYINKEYMPIYERENLEHLYIEYKVLGGNGVIENLMEKLDELPTEERN